MALILHGATTCPLCEKTIDHGDGIVATSAFLDRDHPLWEYSDAAMRQPCFVAWRDRDRFINAFYDYHWKHDRGIWQMLDDGQIVEHEPRPELADAAF